MKGNLMKILITRVGPWSDKGMAAITLSMVKALMEKLPNASIRISEPVPQEVDVTKYREYGLEVLSGMFPAVHSATFKLKFIKFRAIKAVVLLPLLLYSMARYTLWLALYKGFRIDAGVLIADAKDVVREYRESDWIIFSGGQHIMNISPGLLTILYEIIFGKLLGKPVMMYAQSFGPFNPKYARWLIKWVLNKVDLITTREELSMVWLNHIGVASRVFTTADAAFILPSISKQEAMILVEYETGIPQGELMIGVTAIHHVPDQEYAEDKMEGYIAALAGAIDYIITRLNAHVIFFPHVTYTPGKDDRITSARIFDKIQDKSKVIVVTKDYTPEQLKSMYGCMSIFIGSRFHSCIFALSMNVPTITIEYHGHKAMGIMKMLDLDDYVCNFNTVTAEDLILKIDKIWEEKERVREELKRKIDIMQGKSRENVQLAMEYLGLANHISSSM
ncbi:polysaccharide pyruvyl transferase family protein [Chloroflexota bacterium]